jgi:hypothetical protein
MTLRRLQVTDFRCLQSVDLPLDPEFTLISGANASARPAFWKRSICWAAGDPSGPAASIT